MIGQGGADLSLTAKVASVKRFSPADRAGLEKMDYVWTVNGKEVRRFIACHQKCSDISSHS